MAKKSKRYRQLLEKVDTQRAYPLEEAFTLVKDIANAEFDETLEVSVKLGIDPKKPDQTVRGTVNLPFGTGKKVKVLVITRGEEEKEAKEKGADYVGFKEYIEKIKTGWTDFDYIVATPEVMPEISKLGRVLGPRGLMPSPKTGTVTKNVGKIVEELKKGKVEFKVDRTGNLHIPIGKSSFEKEKLIANFLALISGIQDAKPQGFKGVYIQKIILSPTMGPGIKLDIQNINEKTREIKV